MGDELDPPAPTSTAPASTAAAAPSFVSSVRTATAADLGDSWREGCPVEVEDLRGLRVTHWDDIGDSVSGAIVVHADHAEDVFGVFLRLFQAEFPIYSLRPVTEFDNDDNASMTANNTSAFNCREIDGRPGVWSQHAYGGRVLRRPRGVSGRQLQGRARMTVSPNSARVSGFAKSLVQT
jgi:hypothetical protein